MTQARCFPLRGVCVTGFLRLGMSTTKLKQMFYHSFEFLWRAWFVPLLRVPYQIYLGKSLLTYLYGRWLCFSGYLRWLVQALKVLNQYQNNLWIPINEHLKAFSTVRMLALVNMSFHAGLLLIYSVSNSQKKQKTKNPLFVVWTFPIFQTAIILHFSSLVTFWVHKDHPYTIISGGLDFCSVTHHRCHPFLPPRPSLLVSNACCPSGFCHFSVSHPLRYVLILNRNDIEFAHRQVSHKNEMSGFV